jgi:hypothetical protein
VPVRLRYLGYDLAMPEGQFVIGRAPGCRLCLSDPIVSRRHAMITVTRGHATIEDLGSQNGVIVNGERIQGPRQLAEGDRIVIGGQELTYHLAVPGTPPPNEPPRPEDAEEERALHEITTVGQSVIGVERQIEAFEKVGVVAQKALTLGRVDEAERVLTRPLSEVLSTARCGLDVPKALVESAARQATRLGAATRNGYWVDYVFDLYTIRGEALPGDVIKALGELAPLVSAVDTTTIRVYLAVRKKVVAKDPSATAMHTRIEELARLFGVG